MKTQVWLKAAPSALKGKTVVITGATGGLGREICSYILSFGGRILMVNRNRQKSEALCASLREKYPGCQVSFLLADLEHTDEVRAVCAQLLKEPVDVLMLNAGTYAIPRALSDAGYDTVFQTNFVSHYLMVKLLLPVLSQRRARVVATGSIAHRFHPLDPQDIDFAHHEGANDIYGNSKRFLMFSLMELLKDSPVSFAVGHPGISFTGITAHYPPNVLKIVKPSMLLLFMHPEKACRSMVKAIFEPVPYGCWLGPKYFDIWGNPCQKPLTACPEPERQKIFSIAEEIYKKLP